MEGFRSHWKILETDEDPWNLMEVIVNSKDQFIWNRRTDTQTEQVQVSTGFAQH